MKIIFEKHWYLTYYLNPVYARKGTCENLYVYMKLADFSGDRTRPKQNSTGHQNSPGND